jgi:hypothetical protein
VVTIKDLLTEHFVKWQYESGVSKMQSEFANYIGEGEKYLSMVMNGRKASKRQIQSFAAFFKDPRFYDAANIDRPEPLKDYTQRNWGGVPEDVKWKIVQQISEYTTEPLPNGDEDDTKPSQQ